MIAGGAAGGSIGGVLLLLVIVFFFQKYSKKRAAAAVAASDTSPGPADKYLSEAPNTPGTPFNQGQLSLFFDEALLTNL